MTFSTHHRRKLFVVETYARLFLQTVYRHRRESRYQLHAFVVMPEHVHLLLTPAIDVTIERAIQLVKGAYSYELGGIIGRDQELWECGFTDHRIRNEMDFIHHQNYIHRNPVERGIVNEPSEYRYCSAFPGFKLDPGPQRLKPQLLKPLRWHE